MSFIESIRTTSFNHIFFLGLNSLLCFSMPVLKKASASFDTNFGVGFSRNLKRKLGRNVVIPLGIARRDALQGRNVVNSCDPSWNLIT